MTNIIGLKDAYLKKWLGSIDSIMAYADIEAKTVKKISAACKVKQTSGILKLEFSKLSLIRFIKHS